MKSFARLRSLTLSIACALACLAAQAGATDTPPPAIRLSPWDQAAPFEPREVTHSLDTCDLRVVPGGLFGRWDTRLRLDSITSPDPAGGTLLIPQVYFPSVKTLQELWARYPKASPSIVSDLEHTWTWRTRLLSIGRHGEVTEVEEPKKSGVEVDLQWTPFLHGRPGMVCSWLGRPAQASRVLLPTEHVRLEGAFLLWAIDDVRATAPGAAPGVNINGRIFRPGQDISVIANDGAKLLHLHVTRISDDSSVLTVNDRLLVFPPQIALRIFPTDSLGQTSTPPWFLVHDTDGKEFHESY